MSTNDKFSFTKDYITKDGKPWFPVMGEIHYSRYPKQYWKESLLKMKAGGVTVISTYALWIHHEEIENQWDFEGNKDLRAFVETVKECGLYMVLRVGPWCHAECRNGGFPDWLLNKDFSARTNDEKYFAEVHKWYSKLFEQVKGLLYKDGGAIIGVQIENEFGHCGGLTGEAGETHMGRLLDMAKEIGFDVPLYTATGWGGAITHGMLPVMGGYVDAPWDQRTSEIEPSGNYVITYERNDHNIGSDYGLHEGITFDMTKYPYLTAELGGGLQPTFKRRPVPTASDIGAETLVKLASGCNLLGYYMYHGGTNPDGKLTTLQESTATKYLNDLPELSYDFFAPIKEYGQTSKTYGELKLYSLFVKDFGEKLCKMSPKIPSENPLDPADKTHVRFSYRIDSDNSGFLFVNNYVRHQKQDETKQKVFSIPEAQVSFEGLDIKNQDYFFLPFNMKIADSVLETAYVSPLCRLNNNEEAFIFYKNASSSQAKNLYNFKNNKMPAAKIITLSREEAKNSFKVELNAKEFLIVFDGELISENGTLTFTSKNKIEFASYPALDSVPQGFEQATLENGLTLYKSKQQLSSNAKIEVTPRSQFEQDKTVPYMELTNEYKADGKIFFDVKISDMDFSKNVSDYFANIYYNGSYARLYDTKTKRLVADNLFCGKDISWEIGLKRFAKDNDLKELNFVLEIQGLNEKTPVYLEDKPVFENGVAKSFEKALLIPQFTFTF